MARKTQSLNLFQDRKKPAREILTPEGVPLSVELAPVSERAAAFMIDVVFWNLAVFLLTLPFAIFRNEHLNGEIVTGIAFFLSFLIRNTYFLHFELAWRGATPGKRIVGLRVIDRNGGPLMPSAVIARNLTREFEIFMPLAVLLSLQGAVLGGFAEWLSFAWLLVIGAIPFLNRDRMRGGDLIAGTLVISLPRQSLLADQAQDQFHYSFTDQQLLAYGNYELQVLEDILRGAGTSAQSAAMLRLVGEKIRKKIGWTGNVPQDREQKFLQDFYTAERSFLERQQLFGKAKPDKHHKPGRSAPAPQK